MAIPRDPTSNWLWETYPANKLLTPRACAKILELITGLIMSDVSEALSYKWWSSLSDSQIWMWNTSDVELMLTDMLRQGYINVWLHELGNKGGYRKKHLQADYREILRKQFEENCLRQNKKTQKGIFLPNVKKTRIKNPNWMKIRIPHK